MRLKVIIGSSTFAEEDKTPLRLLEAARVDYMPNPLGRRWSEEETIRHLQGFDGLLAGLEPLNRRVLESTQGQLKALARIGIGMNNVDQAAAAELGIKVSNTPDAPTEAVAEMTLTALLCLARDLEGMNRAMHAGLWPKSIARSLAELSVLIVGFGRIGRGAARRLAVGGCTVRVCDPFLPAGAACEFPLVSLDEGLAWADVVSLHASGATPILGEAEFARVRPGVILLNPSRGELVDETALFRALDNGRVGKAWFDAFWREPYEGGLKNYPQVMLTPHACTYTRRCRRDMETEAVRNLLRDLSLRPATPA
jgi:D-3-phosphoglycerate dehydrogenase